MRGRRPVSYWHGMAAARAGTRGQSVTIQQPVTFANGIADGFRCIGDRAVSLTDGVRMAGRVFLLTGSGFLGARPLIILSRTGAVRQAGGVIRSPGLRRGCRPGGRDHIAIDASASGKPKNSIGISQTQVGNRESWLFTSPVRRG